jgi:hypothetical protein
MTNTSFIGGVNRYSNSDKITPFVSYKVVSMLNPDEHGDVKIFGPHHSFHHYGFSDEALCSTKKPCTHFEDCSCGFYGYSLVEDAISHWEKQCEGKYDTAVALVQVAFSGKVTVCEKGYRASHQRIRKILFSSCCFCSRPGEMIAPHENGSLVPICDGCLGKISGKAPKARFGKRKNSPANSLKTWSFDEFSARHSPSGFRGIEIGSISDFSRVEYMREFFGVGNLFPFLPGENTDIPSNFSDYLSTLNQTDMDKMLALVSGEMGKRMMDSGNFTEI